MNTSLSLNLLLLLLCAPFSCRLVIVPVSAKVFLSIDCGSSSLEPHTDENSIVWVGDDPYVQNGEAHRVNTPPPNIPAFDSSVMSTLRAFPTRKKNCYTIDIDDIAEDTTTVERVLVRASFYYGNYDNKANPPTFNLQFNGNNWTQIVTGMDDLGFKEVVYSVKKGNNINICLAQTQPDHIPFISALEIRSLDSDTYGYVGSDYPLFFKTRIAFGSSTTIRFPEDSFDRIWPSFGPLTNAINLIRVMSNSPSIIDDTDDKAPEAVLRTVLTRFNSTDEMAYTGVSDPNVPHHYNAYFSEVIILNSTQKRSFNIVINDKLDSIILPKNPVIPPYGRALEVHILNVTSSAIDSSFTMAIVPTNDSTLPPLINALEGYTIGHKLVQGTNSTDVKALGLLQKSFIQLQDWSGDPCLPSPYTWDWIACDSDTNSPRITALHLNDFGLVGILPDFSAMDALKTIDLHNNSLVQEIPDFLGTFPKLEVLNLADNKFSGTIPSSLSNNIDLRFNASGNPKLVCTNISICTPSRSNGSKTLAQPIIILSIMLFGLLL